MGGKIFVYIFVNLKTFPGSKFTYCSVTTRRINLEGNGRKQLWVVIIHRGGISWGGDMGRTVKIPKQLSGPTFELAKS